MIIFDASYLIPYLHPAPETPMDRTNKPVADFKARINYLVTELNGGGEVIGVPTPALAEILVRAGKGKYTYLATIGNAYRFEVLPFDQRAAIDASELIQLIKKEAKLPLRTWAKVKFDIQIAAIGKAVGATTIYSDDTDIEAHGKRFNIPVKRICDLPPPPKEKAKQPEASVTVTPSAQSHLFPPPDPTLNDRAETEPTNTSEQDSHATSEDAAPNPAAISGTDGERPQGEAAGEAEPPAPQGEREKRSEAGEDGGLRENGS